MSHGSQSFWFNKIDLPDTRFFTSWRGNRHYKGISFPGWGKMIVQPLQSLELKVIDKLCPPNQVCNAWNHQNFPMSLFKRYPHSIFIISQTTRSNNPIHQNEWKWLHKIKYSQWDPQKNTFFERLQNINIILGPENRGE